MEYSSSFLNYEEIYYMFVVLNNKKHFPNNENKIKLCSHSHEKFFLNKNDSKILDTKSQIFDKSYGILDVLYSKLEWLSSETTPDKCMPYKQLNLEFCETTEDKSNAEVLLFCVSLLLDFHEESKCSPYISLALKFYLRAYEYIRYSEFGEPSDMIIDLLEYLKYISLYKCDRKLIFSYIKEFLYYYETLHPQGSFKAGKDPLYPILKDVCKIAHDLHFDFLSVWRDRKMFLGRQYTQHSILENFERFIILVNYGYEDRCYVNAVEEYKEAIITTDMDNLFHFRGIPVKIFNNVMYRSFQIFYLFIKNFYYTETNSSKKGEKILWLIWKSIPDPFLTKKQFLLSFRKLDADVQPALHKAWNWYEDVVLSEYNHHDLIANSPRSLRHIAKLYIRRRLNVICARASNNVKCLDLPVTLKRYLCLEH